MNQENKVLLQSVFLKNNLHITEIQFDLLDKFVDLVLEWNTKLNLISRKDEHNIWVKHVLGSLLMISHMRFDKQSRIVDVGTGGGFPGIPLAICLPEIHFTLVDSIQKKIKVVNDMITKLELPNVVAVCSRAEELCATKEHRGHYDCVLARAVAPINDIVRWTKPFLKKTSTQINNMEQTNVTTQIESGTIVIFKGGDISLEIQETEVKQNPKSINIIPLTINGLESFDFTDKKLVIVRP